MNQPKTYYRAIYERYEQLMTEQCIALEREDYELCGELEREMEELEREMDLCITTSSQL